MSGRKHGAGEGTDVLEKMICMYGELIAIIAMARWRRQFIGDIQYCNVDQIHALGVGGSIPPVALFLHSKILPKFYFFACEGATGEEKEPRTQMSGVWSDQDCLLQVFSTANGSLMRILRESSPCYIWNGSVLNLSGVEN